MRLKDAIALRVKDLCQQNKLSVHALSLKTGVANSTLVDIVKARNESFQIKFIYEICAGLNYIKYALVRVCKLLRGRFFLRSRVGGKLNNRVKAQNLRIRFNRTRNVYIVVGNTLYVGGKRKVLRANFGRA